MHCFEFFFLSHNFSKHAYLNYSNRTKIYEVLRHSAEASQIYANQKKIII